jgi:hypothetical protein
MMSCVRLTRLSLLKHVYLAQSPNLTRLVSPPSKQNGVPSKIEDTKGIWRRVQPQLPSLPLSHDFLKESSDATLSCPVTASILGKYTPRPGNIQDVITGQVLTMPSIFVQGSQIGWGIRTERCYEMMTADSSTFCDDMLSG